MAKKTKATKIHFYLIYFYLIHLNRKIIFELHFTANHFFET